MKGSRNIISDVLADANALNLHEIHRAAEIPTLSCCICCSGLINTPEDHLVKLELRLHDAAGPHPHSQHVRLCRDVQWRDDSIHVLKETGEEEVRKPLKHSKPLGRYQKGFRHYFRITELPQSSEFSFTHT